MGLKEWTVLGLLVEDSWEARTPQESSSEGNALKAGCFHLWKGSDYW